jgi:ankyrin repeat protein
VVCLLLDQNANVNQACDTGETPLYIASQNGHEAGVQLLLSHNANVNQATNFGVTPLYIASQEGHHTVVQLLLAQNANFNRFEMQMLHFWIHLHPWLWPPRWQYLRHLWCLLLRQ